jgi:hypothetical protein
MMQSIRRLLYGVGLTVLPAVSVLARPAHGQPPLPVPPVTGQQQDTTKTPEERIRDLLRNLGPLIRPDSLPADSLADTLGVAAQQAVRGGAPGTLTGVQRDSIMQELLRLPGYSVTEYRAGHARFDADSARLDLKRDAEVLDRGQRVSADSSLTWWERRSLACAYGTPEVSGAGVGEPISGDSLCYNMATNIGMVRGARTTVSQGANWRVGGDLWVRGDDYYAHDGIFTDCDLEEPHYHFAASEMKVVRGQTMVARNVTMCFQDVCVLWLPFFVQSLQQGRRTGLLTPRFSINDIVRNSASYSRRIEDVGFFWAMNDYMGAIVALDWFSNNWTAVRGSFDYSIQPKFLRGGVTMRRFWELGGSRQFTMSANNSWEPDERTRLSVNANYASSSRFVRDQSFDPRELNRNIGSTAGLNRRFDWGTVQLNGSRTQYLSDGTVNTVLPNLGVNLSSVTLFPALRGEEEFYSNASWTASADARVESRSIGEDNTSLSLQSQRDVTARLTSGFNMGRFSLSQSVNLTDERLDGRDLPGDTLPQLLARGERRMLWNTNVSYQQRLIATTTLTPSLGLSGQLLEGDTTNGYRIAAPTRINFSAGMQTALYGFFGGVGPVEAIRHRVSPSFTYSYSPAPSVTPAQELYFGISNVREQNSLSIGLNQTFEAKMRQRPDSMGVVPAPDSLAPDTTGLTGGPRRLPRAQVITLLSISTSALVYDFVEAREGDGITTTQISNSLTSDLVRGFQLSLAHDLFRQTRILDDDGALLDTQRDFAPHLSRLTASFSLNNNSGLFRLIGLGRRTPETPPAPDTAQTPEPQPDPAGEFGLVGGPTRASGASAPTDPVGTWSANFNYTLIRPREDVAGAGLENQQLQANVRFQPTENWSLSWNTGYSFTRAEFTDHLLSLTRRLHDWDAHFDFIKAQNGNFSFQFRVSLRANPDIKLDYEQRDQPARPTIIR